MTTTLRKAALLMRLRAGDATPGPWLAVNGGVEGAGTVFQDSYALRDDVVYIASWHPAVALAVAAWLVEIAEMCEMFEIDETEDPRAFAVARAYLSQWDTP